MLGPCAWMSRSWRRRREETAIMPALPPSLCSICIWYGWCTLNIWKEQIRIGCLIWFIWLFVSNDWIMMAIVSLRWGFLIVLFLAFSIDFLQEICLVYHLNLLIDIIWIWLWDCGFITSLNSWWNSRCCTHWPDWSTFSIWLRRIVSLLFLSDLRGRFFSLFNTFEFFRGAWNFCLVLCPRSCWVLSLDIWSRFLGSILLVIIVIILCCLSFSRLLNFLWHCFFIFIDMCFLIFLIWIWLYILR